MPTGRVGLRETDLEGVDLQEADLGDANLDGANLADANLEEANVTGEQLAQAESLRGAALPQHESLGGLPARFVTRLQKADWHHRHAVVEL